MLGVQDGFKWLVQRDASKVRELSIPDVSRIHLAGGSFLGTSRENPTRSPERLAAVVETLTLKRATTNAAAGGFMLATDVADYLVGRGMPFREAHEVVAGMVRSLIERDLSFSALSLDDWRS